MQAQTRWTGFTTKGYGGIEPALFGRLRLPGTGHSKVHK